MILAERLALIKQVGEEIVTEEELTKLLATKEEIIAYDGFEPSGQIHIAQGLLRAININKMIKAGIKFKILIADWHAMANNKLGGDLEKIQLVGRYFIDVWKACGIDLSKVEFVWASNLVKEPKYWELVIRVGRSNALRRFIRTAEIMGREQSLDKLTGAMIIYSCMQTADIFYLGARICQLGMDQRKINMLAREIGPSLGFWKPVVVSHHMLMGLKGVQISKETLTKEEKMRRINQLKMSKSHPESAIFMTDTYEEIKAKINKAFCPEGVVEGNPILEYYRYLIFESLEKLKLTKLKICRSLKFGGDLYFSSYEELEKNFVNKDVHPLDLKENLVDYLDRLLQPVRDFFRTNAEARNNFERVRKFQVTR
ncbi:MAG: tyrosine--tRNA ligase [Patescibacteria group bacterium]|nr:tyrosine--tRNA ligase [Patescibacteria group bacterium]